MQPGFLRAMGVIHFALSAGVVMFLIVVIALVQLNGNIGLMQNGDNADLELIFYIIVYVSALSTTAFGIIIFERNMRHAKNFVFVKEKIEIFKSAYIIRMAMAEGPAFVSIIIYMLTANYYYLPVTALCLLSIIGARPTLDFVAEKLYLNEKEKEELQKN